MDLGFTDTELAPFLEGLSLDGPVEPFLVFADWLQQRGDAWGELIALDCALESASGERAEVLQRERARLLGEHGKRLCSLGGADWRRGFVRSVEAHLSHAAEPAAFRRELDALVASPAAALLGGLWIHSVLLLDPHGEALLAAGPRLSRLKELRVSSHRFSTEIVDRLRAAWPAAELERERVEWEDQPAGPEHRAFIRMHGVRSIEDIED